LLYIACAKPTRTGPKTDSPESELGIIDAMESRSARRPGDVGRELPVTGAWRKFSAMRRWLNSCKTRAGLAHIH